MDKNECLKIISLCLIEDGCPQCIAKMVKKIRQHWPSIDWATELRTASPDEVRDAGISLLQYTHLLEGLAAK